MCENGKKKVIIKRRTAVTVTLILLVVAMALGFLIWHEKSRKPKDNIPLLPKESKEAMNEKQEADHSAEQKDGDTEQENDIQPSNSITGETEPVIVEDSGSKDIPDDVKMQPDTKENEDDQHTVIELPFIPAE